jgi:hypothetical protein
MTLKLKYALYILSLIQPIFANSFHKIFLKTIKCIKFNIIKVCKHGEPEENIFKLFILLDTIDIEKQLIKIQKNKYAIAAINGIIKYLPSEMSPFN